MEDVTKPKGDGVGLHLLGTPLQSGRGAGSAQGQVSELSPQGWLGGAAGQRDHPVKPDS